jgi:hypothetical protein
LSIWNFPIASCHGNLLWHAAALPPCVTSMLKFLRDTQATSL